MSDSTGSGGGDDDLDPSAWLAKQFGAPEADEPKVEKPQPAAPETGQPQQGLPWEQPATSAPAPQAGGFNWGLGDSQPPAEPTPPVVPEQPAPVLPPAPVAPPATVPPAPVAPAEPPAFDPSMWGAPEHAAEPPTVALPWESAPEPIAAEPPTELLDSRPASDPSNPLDSLFGESAFKEYEDQGALATVPFGAAAATSGNGGDGTPRAPRKKGDPLPRTQKILLWVAGGLLAVLILVVLFFVGTRLPALLGTAPVAIATKTPTATPTPTATVAAGPVGVGLHKWSDLRGGECVNPFTSVWAETFTVIDCATPHSAQMVFRGTFPPIVVAPSAAASTATPAPTATAVAPGGYPGIAALQAQINLLCTTPGVINLAAAGAYTDIQFQASYAASAQEWNNGQHDYFCFITRKSGQPITGSLAMAPAAG
ncbi:MAG: hypothetical protein JWN80_2820 [Microbacteriaceae bacterium]|nr:hypothetical protein [Microbacteriaceae bacterium]